jgi:hypothetical protein
MLLHRRRLQRMRALRALVLLGNRNAPPTLADYGLTKKEAAESRMLNRDIKLRNSPHLCQICASTARQPDTAYHGASVKLLKSQPLGISCHRLIGLEGGSNPPGDANQNKGPVNLAFNWSLPLGDAVMTLELEPAPFPQVCGPTAGAYNSSSYPAKSLSPSRPISPASAGSTWSPRRRPPDHTGAREKENKPCQPASTDAGQCESTRSQRTSSGSSESSKCTCSSIQSARLDL